MRIKVFGTGPIYDATLEICAKRGHQVVDERPYELIVLSNVTRILKAPEIAEAGLAAFSLPPRACCRVTAAAMPCTGRSRWATKKRARHGFGSTKASTQARLQSRVRSRFRPKPSLLLSITKRSSRSARSSSTSCSPNWKKANARAMFRTNRKPRTSPCVQRSRRHLKPAVRNLRELRDHRRAYLAWHRLSDVRSNSAPRFRLASRRRSSSPGPS